MQEFLLSKNNFKISIIVAVYNAGLYLSKCIDSILRQSYSNLQIILIDDGSSDDSGEICDRYAKIDKRIEVYHTANKGAVAARKFGLSHSEGDYIGFVDADDYIEANMFEVLLETVCEGGADFVHTGYIEEKGKEKKEIYGFENELLVLPGIKNREDALVKYVLRADNKTHISSSLWSKLYKKELICKCFSALPNEQQYGEDLLCLCLCILESKSIKLRKCALYHYVVQKKSLCHLEPNEHIIEETKRNYNIINLLENYRGETYERLKKHISYYLKKSYLDTIKALTDGRMHIPCFYFKDADNLIGKKIIIYGTGVVGQDYYLQLCKYSEIEIVAWLDTNWQNYRFDYVDIKGVSALSDYDCDKLIIAVSDEVTAKEIEVMLIKYGYPAEKIFWEKPVNILEMIYFNGEAI